MKVNWTKELLEDVVSNSESQIEVLTKLGIRCAGGNFKTLKKYLELFSIETPHFIKNYDKIVSYNQHKKKSLSEILVVNSSHNRTNLKKRLYEEGLLKRECCLCGQGEEWNGMIISLIIDHINGIYNDNRLINLRIVCPNCNAGLDTFAGKNNKINKIVYTCSCGSSIKKVSNKCNKCDKLSRRKVERPSLESLLEDVNKLGFSATGRKYGVSDNAIRKWIKNYNKE